MIQNPKLKLLELQRHPSNQQCVDCGEFFPQWASVTFAIYFCLSCSGLHRSLGVNISFVRSITMDSWDMDQVIRMSLGGNERFLHFLSKVNATTSLSSQENNTESNKNMNTNNNIPTLDSIERRYTSIEAIEYRLLLDKELATYKQSLLKSNKPTRSISAPAKSS